MADSDDRVELRGQRKPSETEEDFVDRVQKDEMFPTMKKTREERRNRPFNLQEKIVRSQYSDEERREFLESMLRSRTKRQQLGAWITENKAPVLEETVMDDGVVTDQQPEMTAACQQVSHASKGLARNQSTTSKDSGIGMELEVFAEMDI